MRKTMKKPDTITRSRVLVTFIAMSMLVFAVFTTGCSNRYAPHDIELPVTESKSAELPELYTSGEPAKVTLEQVESITADMTYGQMVEHLGATLDSGSGSYVLVYALEGGKQLVIPVSRWDEPVGKTGKALLEAFTKE